MVEIALMAVAALIIGALARFSSAIGSASPPKPPEDIFRQKMGTPRPGNRNEVPFPATVIGVPPCTARTASPLAVNERLLKALRCVIFCL